MPFVFPNPLYRFDSKYYLPKQNTSKQTLPLSSSLNVIILNARSLAKDEGTFSSLYRPGLSKPERICLKLLMPR